MQRPQWFLNSKAASFEGRILRAIVTNDVPVQRLLQMWPWNAPFVPWAMTATTGGPFAAYPTPPQNSLCHWAREIAELHLRSVYIYTCSRVCTYIYSDWANSKLIWCAVLRKSEELGWRRDAGKPPWDRGMLAVDAGNNPSNPYIQKSKTYKFRN